MIFDIGRSIDDLEVGTRRSVTRTFTADDVERFASLTGDHDYLRGEGEGASGLSVVRRIAQDMLVASLATMDGAHFPAAGFVVSEFKVQFFSLVYVRDSVTCTVEVVSIDSEQELLELTATWVNQHGEPVARGTFAGWPAQAAVEPAPDDRFEVRPLDPLGSDSQWVSRIHVDQWGAAIEVARGVVFDVATLPGFGVLRDGTPLGVATYHLDGDACQLVTLISLGEGRGIGSALVDAVKQAARDAGCRRLWLITTNDNLRALRFYQKRGFELVAVHRAAFSEARKHKPEIPEIGLDGIPLRDEIELEMLLQA